MCQVCDTGPKFDHANRPKLKYPMAKTEPEKVSAALKKAISMSGLTPYEIARRAGTSPQTVTRFLRNERGLSLIVIDRICLALGLELREQSNREDDGIRR